MTACLSHCREAPALLLQLCSNAKEGTQLVQNSPALLPDVGLGPRVGLPGRRQPAGYGTSWSVLVSGTSGRSGSSEPNLFSPFPSTNLHSSRVFPTTRMPWRDTHKVAWLRGRPHNVLRARVVFDCVASWTRLGVRVARGRRPRRRRWGWFAYNAGGGGNFD